MIEIDIDSDSGISFSSNPKMHSNALNILDGMVDMSNEDYHMHEGISSSGFKDMAKSQSAYKHRKLFPIGSDSMTNGTLLHTALLEPHLIDDEFIEATTELSTSVSGKKLQEKNPDKIVVGKNAIEKTKKLAHAVRQVFSDILDDKDTIFEKSVIFYCHETGLTYKARPDMMYKKKNNRYTILDLKRTKENDKHAFTYVIEKYWYHVSAAWYIDVCRQAGIDVDGFGWMCVPTQEGEKPYGVVCSNELIEKGREIYGDLIDAHIEFNETGMDRDKFMVAYSREAIKEMQGK